MTQQYGNNSSALNRLRSILGTKSEPLDPNRKPSDVPDCITCKVHETNRLPLFNNGKVLDLCVQVCKPTLKKTHTLNEYSRPQLMVKYPTLGLTVRMTKDQMISIIEIHLLETDLFGDS